LLTTRYKIYYRNIYR